MAKLNIIRTLTDIPNIGTATAKDLTSIGITTPAKLKVSDPIKLYNRLCNKTGVRHDPCTLDVFISAVRFLNGAPAKPWWAYTTERKKLLNN